MKKEAEKIVNFTPQEISEVSADEIQRLFYNLQGYQIELEMQNEEMKKTQNELSISRKGVQPQQRIMVKCITKDNREIEVGMAAALLGKHSSLPLLMITSERIIN